MKNVMQLYTDSEWSAQSRWWRAAGVVCDSRPSETSVMVMS